MVWCPFINITIDDKPLTICVAFFTMIDEFDNEFPRVNVGFVFISYGAAKRDMMQWGKPLKFGFVWVN